MDAQRFSRHSRRGPSLPEVSPVASLAALLDRQATSAADAIAYAWVGDNLETVELSYGELASQVHSLASRIARHAAPGDRALLVYAPGLEVVSAFWACLYAGIIPVPAPSPDPLRLKNSLPRLRTIAADAGASCVLTSAALHQAAAGLQLDPALKNAVWIATDTDDGPGEAVTPGNTLRAAIAPVGPLAYLQYTSGSTSTPRGVMVSHANVLANCAAASAVYQPRNRADGASRAFSWLPYFHDYGLVQGICWPMYAGITGYLMSPLTFLRRPLRWLEALDRFGVNYTGAPNFAYAACVQALTRVPGWRADLSRLQAATCGAEPINPDTVSQFAAAFAPHGLQAQAFMPAYGLAEATLAVTAQPMGITPTLLKVSAASLASGDVRVAIQGEDARTLVGCGQAMLDTEVQIADTTTGEVLAENRIGEIRVRSPGVCLGYWNNASASTETFGQVLGAGGTDTYLRTGDLGFLRDGELFVAGRLKDLLIVHGRNHYPQDIEWTTERAHPAVRAGHCAAFSIDDGTGEQAVLLVEVTKQTAQETLPEAAARIRRAIAVGHELPLHTIAFVRGGSIPRTTSGKIRRRSCKQLFVDDQLPIIHRDALDANTAGESTAGLTLSPQVLQALPDMDARREALQHWIVASVADITGRNAADISANASPIECGLDSLGAFRLLQNLEVSLGITPTPAQLLGDSSLRDLAQQLLADVESGSCRTAPTPIPRFPAGAPAPLSASQEGLWLLDRMTGSSAAYNIVQALQLDGPVDLALLQTSFDQLLQRHSVLRTRFVEVDGIPRQVVDETARLQLEVDDLLATPAADPKACTARLIATKTARPFDLAHGPLIRVSLLRHSEEQHILLLDVHHIVADGWSIGILVRDLSALYSAGLNSSAPSLPPLTIDYVDYARWQRQRLDSDDLRAQMAYWRTHLANAPPAIELPTDRARPAQAGFKGAIVPFELPAALSQALHELSHREGATLYMTLLAAFQLLLSRWSGQAEVVVGSPTAGRRRGELDNLVGFFINMLVLRCRPSNCGSFADLLKAVRENTLNAYAHQDTPFEQLVAQLQPRRDLSRHPLFQVMFSMRNFPREVLALPGIQWRCIPSEHLTSKVDLTLQLSEEDGRIGGYLEYATDLFDAATIERMACHLRTLLENIVAQPHDALTSISMLPAAESRRRERPSAPEHPHLPRSALSQSLTQRFEQQARTHADRPALSWRDETWTYAELNGRANTIARLLLAEGNTRSEAVLLDFANEPLAIAAILGVLKAGKYYVVLDRAHPAARLRAIASDCGAQTLLSSRPATAVRETTGIALPVMIHIDDTLEQTPDNPRSTRSPDSLAYILYTSGSTGTPKGVVQNDRNVMHFMSVYAASMKLAPEDRITLFSSISLDAAVMDIFAAVLSGASVAIAQLSVDGFVGLFDWLEQQKVTVWHSTPSVLRTALQSCGRPAPRRIRCVVLGGEEARDIDWQLFRDRFASGCPLINGYGLTESSVTAQYEFDHRNPPTGERFPIGRPVAATRIALLAPDGTPAELTGEIVIRSPHVALGYWRDEPLTARAFSIDAEPGLRAYRTGDLGRWRDDGLLEFMGRGNRQVKIQGFRVEPAEVEAALLRIAGVREAAVVAHRTGPADQEVRLYGYVAPQLQATLNAAQLRSQLKQFVPEYMLPTTVTVLPALPLMPNGKLDRNALPTPQHSVAGNTAVSPRGPMEQAIWDIWKEVLRREDFGVHENFFDLGGHSLMAAQVMARIRGVLSGEAHLRLMFEAPTVAELAVRVGEQHDSPDSSRSAPIPTTPHTDAAPAASGQEALWFIDRLLGTSSLYNIVHALRLRGPLDVAALERSAQALIDRHPSLRTAFEEHEDTVVQTVLPEARITLRAEALATDSATTPDQALQAVLEQAAQQPFELTRAPLLRVKLLRIANDDHALLLTLHHIIADGWSLGVLARELGILYGSEVTRTPAVLPTLPIDFIDYAVWQRQQTESTGTAQQLTYWRDKLHDLQEVHLPTDRPRQATRSHAGGVEYFTVPAPTLAALKDLSRAENATLFMTLLATFKALLRRYCGQNDLAVVTPVAGRDRVELEGLIGFFVNSLILRTDLAGNPTFREVLGRVRRTALEAYAHQDLRFETLVAALKPLHDLSHSPLSTVSFALQNMADLQLSLPGIHASTIPLHSGTSKSELSVTLMESEGTLRGTLEYSSELFDAETMQQLARHFLALLAGAIENPDATLLHLPLLAADEQRQIMHEWNDTVRPYGDADGRLTPLHELFAAQAQRTPSAPAVILDRQQINYRELDLQANRLANRLLELGVTTDSPVGVCLERSFDLIVSILAIHKAGGAYLPLDPEYPRERLSFMLEDAHAPVVLTQQRWRERLPQADSTRLFCLDVENNALQMQPEEDPAQACSPQQLAYIVYTSGSTGKPKAAALPHSALSNHLHWLAETLDLTSTDRVLQKTSISFDASVWELLLPLQIGMPVVLARPGEHLDSDYMARTLRDQHITVLQVVPSALQALLAEPVLRECHELRYVISGGEALDRALTRTFFAVLPHATLGNFYGPSETCDDATYFELHAPVPGAGFVPIGRPIANVRCHILDAARQPVPQGAVGELYIGGAGLARGYLHRPQLTAERFLEDPFRSGARLYRTGDLARYRADGVIEYIGRVDSQVKIHGFRIELAEIEAALKACPGVDHCAVSVHVDSAGEKRLLAHVAGEVTDPATLKRRLSARLPEHMVPQIIVPLAQLPLLPNGKIDRRALPEPDFSPAQETTVAPRSPVEQALADIWSEVLRIPAPGVHQSFFALGGHSLLATQVVSRIRRTLQVELPLRTLFESPTIAELAQAVARERSAEGTPPEPPIEALSRDTALPVSFSQRRMWFVQQFEPQATAYNMSFSLRLQGNLNRGALTAAVQGLVRRHEAFRTHFKVANGEPVQIITADATANIEFTDLSSRPAELRETQAAQLLQEAAMKPFDLAHGPLFRFMLVRLSAQDHVVLWLVHHAIGDQWSAVLMARELSALYQAAVRQEQAQLPPLPVQYADFAAWQRRHLGGDALDDQMRYWRRKLQGLPVLTLPTDRPRPPRQTFRGKHVSATLAIDTMSRLKQFSAAHGATPFMTLLAVFKALLMRYSGQDDVAVGTPIANRTRLATENLIGTLVNTLVMRTDAGGDPTFTAFLARVRDTALEAYTNQDLPFERLVEELGGARDAGHAPLVQVLFNVPNAPLGTIEMDGLSFDRFEFQRGSAQFDLTLSVDTEHRNRVYLSYATDLFNTETAHELLHRYVRLLDTVLANPERALSSYSLLDESERDAMLRAWNRTTAPYPADRRADELIAEQALRTPDAAAVSMAERTLTYTELQAQSNRLARYLQERGVRRNSPVGICLERSPEMVVALLAVMKAGGTYVPLDPAFPRERLQFMATDAALKVIVTHSALLQTLPALPGRTICIDEAAHVLSTLPAGALEPCSGPDDLAYVLYTSGSTGKPKGVEIPHRALTNFLCSMRARPGCSTGDRLLAVTTLSFDIAGLEIYLPLLTGAELHLASRRETADGRLLKDRIKQCRPTLMQATPATWRMLIAAGWHGNRNLRILCGGEALPLDLANQLLERCGQLWNLYGPTETTIWSTLNRIEPGAEQISIGRPIANTEVYVLDKALQPVPAGVAGELYIGGHGLARGYRNRPDMTAERFVPHPFATSPGERLYRTGDLVRFTRDGQLLHLGRLDFQVKIRGFRIELGEIEARLARHPAIAQAVVTAREDDTRMKQLVAYATVRDSHAQPDPVELRTFIRTVLPDYMTPTHFVFLQSLPLTANNKIDVNALPEPATQRIAGTVTAEPHGRLEVQLTALWRRVLENESVGIHDNFFDAGGHSLKAVQLVSFIEQVYGQELPLATFFQAPTIAQMARILEKSHWRPSWRSLVAIQPAGKETPVFAIPGVGGNVLMFARLSKRLCAERPFYGLQARGLDNAQRPFTSVRGAARHYVQEIRSIRTHGPYIIAGACTGGVVAYEMAQQLRRAGEKVTLMLLESWHPSSARRPLFTGSLIWPLSTLWSRLTGRYSSNRVARATWHAVAHYRPKPLRGRLLHVIATNRFLHPHTKDTRRLWDELALEGCETQFVDAIDSGQLFAEAHVDALAAHVRDYIARESL